MVAVPTSAADALWPGCPTSVRKAVSRFGLPDEPDHEAFFNAAPDDATSDEPFLLSKGSAGHAQGECRPCAWRWKPGGCSNGIDCLFCHVCDQGALKVRKKERQLVIKARLKQKEAGEGLVDATESLDAVLPGHVEIAFSQPATDALDALLPGRVAVALSQPATAPARVAVAFSQPATVLPGRVAVAFSQPAAVHPGRVAVEFPQPAIDIDTAVSGQLHGPSGGATRQPGGARGAPAHSAYDVHCWRSDSYKGRAEEHRSNLDAPPGLLQMSACEAWLHGGGEQLDGCFQL